jgi:hypothetical protein
VSNPFIDFPLGMDEALVVFEFLETVSKESLRAIASEAEVLALLRVAGAIERTIPEVFAPDYEELLAAARVRLEEQSRS